MLQQCNNPYRREVQQRGTKHDDSLLLLVAQSSWNLCRGKYQTAHSACSGETGCQSRCDLERKQKNHTKTKLHPLLPVPESRHEICFTHLLFPLLSSTPLTNKPSLQRTVTQISGCTQIICLPCSAQFSCTHAFPFQPLSDGSPQLRISTEEVGICNKHSDSTGP